MIAEAPFAHDMYTIRRKVFQVFGASFHIYDPAGGLVGFSRQKAFKLREDIRVYTDESCAQELLVIQARNIIDFSAAYDVVDALACEPVGTLQRKGFSSLMRDEWVMADAMGMEVGRVREDSLALALIRRYMANLIPQTFRATAGAMQVAQFRQHFNPFVLKLSVSILPASDGVVDRRLLLAAGVLLAAIEGRQSN